MHNFFMFYSVLFYVFYLFLSELDVCICDKGFDLSNDDVTCVDIDECSDNSTHNCDLNFGVCSNTQGGFNCSCSGGYILGPQYECQGQKAF